jgi:hypothetical protein
MVTKDSHLKLLVLPYKNSTMVVLCVRCTEAMAEVRPNTACSRTPAKYAGAGVVGFAAFLGSFLSSSWFRQSGVISSRPPSATPGHSDRTSLEQTRSVERFLNKTSKVVKNEHLRQNIDPLISGNSNAGIL